MPPCASACRAPVPACAKRLLRRFGDFARSSAPSAAFATTVASALMIAAPGTASAAILLGTGLGTGKLGLGGATVSGGTALGSLSAAFSQRMRRRQMLSLGAVIGGLVGGMLGSYLGGRYLLSYAEHRRTRADPPVRGAQQRHRAW